MHKAIAAIIGLVVWLTATSATANPEDFPRTASGKPDFSGTYDIATLTPYVRDNQARREHVAGSRGRSRGGSARRSAHGCGVPAERPESRTTREGRQRGCPQLRLVLDGPRHHHVQDRRQVPHVDHRRSPQRSDSGSLRGRQGAARNAAPQGRLEERRHRVVGREPAKTRTTTPKANPCRTAACISAT